MEGIPEVVSLYDPGDADDVRLGRAQWHAAWALAHAFGHEWAHRPDVTSLLAVTEDGEQSAESVRAAVFPPPDDAWALIAPTVIWTQGTVGKIPTIVHETGTGRARWEVFPDGAVRVEIRRPKPVGVVIDAYIGPLPQGGDRECDVRQRGAAAFRHWAMLAKIIDAVERADRGWIITTAAQRQAVSST